MSDIKDYRINELRYYVFANLLVLILTYLNVQLTPEVLQEKSLLILAINFLNLAAVSSTIYVFIFISDSLFSGDLKFFLLYLWNSKPGENIFQNINKNTKDMRFSINDVKKRYKDVYANMPKGKREIKIYQNQQWYKIYHSYKQVDMVSVSAKEFRLCRDIYIATLNLLFMFLLSCFFLKILVFSKVFFAYMLIMLVLTNCAARVKGKKWVYNVIAYDIMESLK